MSIAVRAKIIGMDPLIRKLKVMPDKARAAFRVALAQEADAICGLMSRLAPVDSGDLRDSISWTWGNNVPKGAMAIATKGKGDLSITIFAGNADAWYARLVEFGTAPHVNGGEFAGSKHPGTKAQPFFYPGWRAGKRTAKANIRKAMREAVRQEFPKSGPGVQRDPKTGRFLPGRKK